MTNLIGGAIVAIIVGAAMVWLVSILEKERGAGSGRNGWV